MPRFDALLVLLLTLAGCASAPAAREAAEEPDEAGKADPMLSRAGVPHVVVKEAFVSAVTPEDNIDSPAAWRTPEGKTWVFATAKEGKGLVVYDGDTGARLRSVGTKGAGPGEFDRANGVFVQADTASGPGRGL